MINEKIIIEVSYEDINSYPEIKFQIPGTISLPAISIAADALSALTKTLATRFLQKQGDNADQENVIDQLALMTFEELNEALT